MGLEQALFFSYIFVEAVLVGVLIYKRVLGNFPFFFAYCAWDVSTNIGLQLFIHYSRISIANNTTYLQIFTIDTIIDSVLALCVLIELAWSVLRPVRSSLSRRLLIFVAALTLLAGTAIWPFAALTNLMHAGSKQWLLLTQLVQCVSILRILFFLLLAAGSQLLSLSWRDRELQIATGFGFYSFCTVAVSIVQVHQSSGRQYARLYDLGSVAFLCSLLYWTYCFAQQEAQRRAFTPEMQRILLSVAGAAHATRVALTEPQTGNTRK